MSLSRAHSISANSALLQGRRLIPFHSFFSLCISDYLYHLIRTRAIQDTLKIPSSSSLCDASDTKFQTPGSSILFWLLVAIDGVGTIDGTSDGTIDGEGVNLSKSATESSLGHLNVHSGTSPFRFLFQKHQAKKKSWTTRTSEG